MKRAGALLQSIVIIVLTACAACGDDDVVADIDDDTSIIELQTVLEFEGSVTDGVVSVRALGAGAHEQALTVIGEDQNGVRGTAVATNLVELTSESGNGYTPGNVVDGCGVGANGFDVFAGVRSFHTQRLQNLHLQIIETSNAGANALCNSDRSSANIVVDGAPVSSTLGLVRYGSLAPDTNGPGTAPSAIVPLPRGTDSTARARRLRFRTTTGTFSFRGRILAEVCSDPRCAPGAAFVAAADADTRPAFIDTDGDVLAVAEGNGVAWLGGTFTRAGRRTGALFRADTTTTGTAKAWPSIEGGGVNAVVVDAANNVYVGGTFTHVGGVLMPRLAKITSTGIVDTGFEPPPQVSSAAAVTSLAIDGVAGRLWVGRSAAPFLVVLSMSTGAAVTGVTVPEANDQVLCLLIVGDDVFVGGRFTGFLGLTGNKLARLSRTTGALGSGFSLGAAATETVRALAVSGTTLYAVGEFTLLTRKNAVAFSIPTTLTTSWDPKLDGPGNAIAIVDSTVFIGGEFANITYPTGILSTATVARPRLAAVNLSDGTPAAFNPSPNAAVRSLALSGSSLLVGGDFTSIAGVTTHRALAALPATPTVATPTPTTFNPSPGGGVTTPTVNAMVVIGNDVVAGGAFALGGGVPRSRLAAVNLASGELTSANVVVTGTAVNALVQRTGQLFIGGSFANVGGSARNNIAVIDATTQAVDTFNGNALGAVNALAVDDSNRVYVGGAFTNFAASGRGRLVRLTSTTTLDTTFTATLSTDVNALGATADGVLVGSATGLVRLGGTGAVVTTLAPSSSGAVRAIVVAADRRSAWIGGTFTTLGGAARVNLAKVALRAASTTIDPAFTRAGIAGGGVFALDVDGPALVVGGAFTAPRNRLAVVDIESGNLLNAEPLSGVATDVLAVRQTGPVVVAGGRFGSGALLDIVGVDGGARRSSVAAFFGEGEAETPGSEPMPSSGCGRALSSPYVAGARALVSVVVDGRTRDARVRVPLGYDSGRAWPVVFAFHGDQQCTTLAADGSCAVAPALPIGSDVLDIDSRIGSDAITIHIEGENLNRFGPNFSWDTLSTPNGPPKNPDIAAVLAFQQKLRADLCIDDARLFAGGFSGGGFLTHALACYGVPSLKAVGVLEGGFENGQRGGAANVFDTALCGAAQNVVVIHNTANPTVPFATFGQPAVTFWRTKASCDATPVVDPGISTCSAFVGCSSRDVLLCRPSSTAHTVTADGANAFAAFIRRYF